MVQWSKIPKRSKMLEALEKIHLAYVRPERQRREGRRQKRRRSNILPISMVQLFFCVLFFSLCTNLSTWPGRQVVPIGSRCYIPIFDGLVGVYAHEHRFNSVRKHEHRLSHLWWESLLIVISWVRRPIVGEGGILCQTGHRWQVWVGCSGALDYLDHNVVGRIGLDGWLPLVQAVWRPAVSFHGVQIIWQSWDLRQLWHGSAWTGEQGERQESRILIWWWVKNVEDVELMDEVVEDVNKVASSARTSSDEKEI